MYMAIAIEKILKRIEIRAKYDKYVRYSLSRSKSLIELGKGTIEPRNLDLDLSLYEDLV